MFRRCLMFKRNILCIDLKSFFASCECIERGLDPFKVPLVVANPKQGNGAITLAITPYLKAQGIKSRTRLYEIPKNIKYTIVPPRMNLYIRKSAEVMSIFLDFVAEEDIHVYSIDEAFLDVTDYLKMYKMDDYNLAKQILKTVRAKTGLSATCGIGPNLLLAKVAMDTEAKKYEDGIAKWTYDDVPTKLWSITPLSKMWGIGSRMERNLNKLGINSIGDLAKYDLPKLKNKFGVIGEELWRHANGLDESRISDWKTRPKDKSYSHSQVLFKDYNGDNIKLIIQEMTEVICARLRQNKKMGSLIGLGIGYSKDIGSGFFHHINLEIPTDDEETILKNCLMIFDRYYNDLPIRKVTISIGKLTEKDSLQLNLFEEYQEVSLKDNYNAAIDEVHQRFGKNSLVKASALMENSTILERNKKIGGHHA